MAEPAPQREGSALVTGASRGIGAAIARSLARDGWRVGVNYRSDRAGAEAVVSAIESEGGVAIALGADVADPGAPDELFGALESHFDGPVLVLVNNAGISRDDLTPSLGDEEWDSVLQTNLTAAFRLTRRALKAMLRARSGRIVNISSAVASARQPRAGELLRLEGRADRADQDVGGRGRAPRGDHQRGRTRTDRHRVHRRGVEGDTPRDSRPAPRDSGRGCGVRALPDF